MLISRSPGERTSLMPIGDLFNGSEQRDVTRYADDSEVSTAPDDEVEEEEPIDRWENSEAMDYATDSNAMELDTGGSDAMDIQAAKDPESEKITIETTEMPEEPPPRDRQGQEYGNSRWLKRTKDEEEYVDHAMVISDYATPEDGRKITVRFTDGHENTMDYEQYADGITEPDPEGEARIFKEFTRYRVLQKVGRNSRKIDIEVLWGDQSKSWEDFDLMKLDLPVTAAHFALSRFVKKPPNGRKRPKILQDHLDWAKDFMALRRVYATRAIKLPYRYSIKYGVKVPAGSSSAILMDKELDDNPQLSKLVNNQRWFQKQEKEIGKFEEHKALNVLPQGVQAPEGYQQMRYHWVFDVKPDGLFKARLVAGGNTVESTGVERTMSVVQSSSTKILFIVAAGNKQTVLIGDLAAAYLHAKTTSAQHHT